MEAAMPDGLYERDILDWAEQQASLLRRLAAGGAADRFTPSMRQRIDLDELWRRAQRQSGTKNGRCAAGLPACPFTLDDLLDPEADPAALAARIPTAPG
jgi:hypothetical protein